MCGKLDFTANQIFFPKKNIFRKKIKKITGFNPRKIDSYKLACIHKSASFYHSSKLINNERLEYLGDALLGSIIAEYLFKKYPKKDEGFLTKLRSKLVNGQTLTKLALETGLDELIVTKSLDKDLSHHVYGNMFEAMIGALYLDRGYKKTRAFITKKIIGQRLDIEKIIDQETNYKSLLIEWAQKHKNDVRFETICIDNTKAHIPEFETHIIIEDNSFGHGTGRSKKEAEQNAARVALSAVKE